MKETEYRNDPRLNASLAKELLRSPLMFRYRQRTPLESTEAMKFGTLVHCMVLEPSELNNRFAVMPKFEEHPENVTAKGVASKSQSTHFYKTRRAEFLQENAGKEIVKQYDWDRAERVANTVLDKPEVAGLLEFADTEVSLFGELEGVPIKGRLDIVGETIADLKVTNTCDPKQFYRVFDRLGYGFQLAWYRELVTQNGGEVKPVQVIAAEPDGAMDCCVFDVPAELLDLELDRVKRQLLVYRHCLETDNWPGVDGGNDSMPLEVPDWAMPDDLVLEF